MYIRTYNPVYSIYCNSTNMQHVLYMYSYGDQPLTDGMERYSDAVDVNALAFRISDTRPASIPPVMFEVCIT